MIGASAGGFGGMIEPSITWYSRTSRVLFGKSSRLQRLPISSTTTL